MSEKKYKIVVVGGGTAGWIAASFLKKYWDDHIDITIIYDHKNPGIGVGESLTPAIYNYLNYVGISRDDMVKNVNATVKLGLIFKNWLNDGNQFIHSFWESPQHNSSLNFGSAYQFYLNEYDQAETYGKFYFDNNKIPPDPLAIQSLHIDATLFSKFIESKFKDKVNVIDGVVTNVILKNNSERIDHIILQDDKKICGDFFIDASGFQRVLFNKLSSEWVDMSDWLPIDKCIPNPLEFEFKTQPPYTISEASDNGWILQVPLSNRWGTGYLYCSEFLSDDQAFDNFNKFVTKNYGKGLTNTSKVLSFKSGYFKKQWVGNCICIGLSSGFAEPLEATNIHHTVYQIMFFNQLFNFKIFEHDIETYNNQMINFYKNVYSYLRFCYNTRRTDSDFWKYMTNNTPREVKNLTEKIINDIPNENFIVTPIFTEKNFLKVGIGLGLINKNSYFEILNKRRAIQIAKNEIDRFDKVKYDNQLTAIDHKHYIDSIKKT